MSEATANTSEPLLRILHPSDFFRASRIAFDHALKLALESKAELEIMHVARRAATKESDVHRTHFPVLAVPAKAA